MSLNFTELFASAVEGRELDQNMTTPSRISLAKTQNGEMEKGKDFLMTPETVASSKGDRGVAISPMGADGDAKVPRCSRSLGVLCRRVLTIFIDTAKETGVAQPYIIPQYFAKELGQSNIAPV